MKTSRKILWGICWKGIISGVVGAIISLALLKFGCSKETMAAIILGLFVVAAMTVWIILETKCKQKKSEKDD